MIQNQEEWFDALVYAAEHNMLVTLCVYCPRTNKQYEFPRARIAKNYTSALERYGSLVFVPEEKYPYDQDKPYDDPYFYIRYYHDHFYTHVAHDRIIDKTDDPYQPQLKRLFVHYF